MIKKIPVDRLLPGMFVSDFNAAWLHHPFPFNSRLMEGEDDIRRVHEAGIRELYIDTARGLDVPGGDAPTAAEAAQAIQDEVVRMATASAPVMPQRTTLAEEMGRARNTYAEATRVIRRLMEDARLGNALAIEPVRGTVEKVTASVLRNPNAMVTIRRLQAVNEYTFTHSVGVCAMLACFGKIAGMSLPDIHDLALGGLLHDIGKARVQPAVLNKPSRLNEEEFIHIKSHVVLGVDLVRQMPGISPLVLAPVERHHERFDGSGYPVGLKGDALDMAGRMAAIVDVYDAMTSDKVYAPGVSPALAVQKLFEWSRHHFDPELTQLFLKQVGIYPVGTVVRLESGRLGVVIAQSETHLLTPVVRVMYDIRRQHYVPVEDIDLSRPLGAGGGDRIVGVEQPERYGVDINRFLAG